MLGYLDPASFAGGQIRIDRGAAERATGEQIGEPLDLDLAAAAWGVHRIANANMERALRSMSIERGRDPRDYALVAFGGAGPLHACELARALGIPRVIVPRGAGVASAIGLLEAERNFTVSLTRTIELDAPGAAGELTGLFAGLEERARDLIGAPGGRPVAWQRHAHVRYAGQGFELRVAIAAGPIDDEFPKRAREAFDSRYEAEYGYAQRDQAAEGTDWFLTGGPGDAPAAVSWTAKGSGRGAPSGPGAGSGCGNESGHARERGGRGHGRGRFRATRADRHGHRLARGPIGPGRMGRLAGIRPERPSRRRPARGAGHRGRARVDHPPPRRRHRPGERGREPPHRRFGEGAERIAHEEREHGEHR